MENNETAVIVWDIPFNQIQRQDWPDIHGTVFITIDPNVTPNGQKWKVSQWRDDKHENVHGLGSFWTKEDAVIFANAKADKIDALKGKN